MIDKIDEKIIKLLAKNGRIKLSDIAKHVNLSISPCQARLKKLENQKYILGYHARVNYEKMQKAHVAFVQVVLSDSPTLNSNINIIPSTMRITSARNPIRGIVNSKQI